MQIAFSPIHFHRAMKTMQSKTCLFSFFLLLSFFFSIDAQAPKPPSGVLANKIVTVDPKPGKANFTTIGAALAAAPTNLSPAGYYIIFIAKGIYAEYLTVAYNQQHVMLIGSGIGRTIITGSKSVGNGSNTYDSATFVAIGEGFVAKKITFRNTAGPGKQQAVAVRNSADKSAFYLCSFEGYQATLYAHIGTQFYKSCDIYGTVDTVFGNAAAVFQNSNVYPRAPIPGAYNTITAHGRTDPTQQTGFVFQKCNVIGAPGSGAANTYLGRPWGAYSRTVFIQSNLGPVVNPAGWAPWSGTTGLTTLYYAEYANSGPGSVTASRVKWAGFHVIDATAANAFTVLNFIQGNLWIKSTGVPFYPTLR